MATLCITFGTNDPGHPKGMLRAVVDFFYEQFRSHSKVKQWASAAGNIFEKANVKANNSEEILFRELMLSVLFQH